MYIVDANILIGYANRSLSQNAVDWFERQAETDLIQIAAITRTEYLAKPGVPSDQIKVDKAFLNRFIILTIGQEIADVGGYLRSRFGLLLGDSIVAATGLFYDLPAVTADGRGFHKVTGLKVLRPEDL